MPETPPYKFENLEIKTTQELTEAKKEAGVRSEEEALQDALKHAIETKDNVLMKNVFDKIKELGARQYQEKNSEIKPEAKKEDSKIQKNEAMISSEDVSTFEEFVAQSGLEGARLNRAKFLYHEKGFNTEEIKKQMALEEKQATVAKQNVSYRAEQGGVIEKVYRDKETLTEDRKDLKKEAQERN